jgi:hypothetical protein
VYPGTIAEGFRVTVESPVRLEMIVREPTVVLNDLKPETTYRGTIESLDNPYAAAPFGFWTRPAGVTGYALPLSAIAGAEVDVFVSTSAATATLVLRPVTNLEAVAGKWENIATRFQYAPYAAPAQGCSWERTATICLPGDLPSNAYSLDVEAADGSVFHIPLLVRPTENVDVAVVCSTDTWNAYNNWGGQSYYDNFIGAPEPLWDSEARPNHIADPYGHGAYLLGAEGHILKHFARHGISYGVYSDLDMAAGRVKNCKTLVLCAHNEYWCADKVRVFDGLQRKGVNIVCLSGNTFYRKIVREASRYAAVRYALFSEEEVCPRLGTIYTAAGRETGAPFAVVKPEHWIFEGTGVKAGDLFGKHSLEVLGASGVETDKVTRFSPPNTEIVARGTNVVGGAEWVVFRHADGGLVVNTSSMTAAIHMADPVMDRMLLNVMARLGHAVVA